MFSRATLARSPPFTMIKIGNSPTSIHTVSHPIEVVNFLLYHPETVMPGYVELVARTMDGRELVQSYDRLYVLNSDKNYLIQYELPLGVASAVIWARLRIPYQPNHTREAWLQATVLSSSDDTTTDRLLALAAAVDGVTATVDSMDSTTTDRLLALAAAVDGVTAQVDDVATTVESVVDMGRRSSSSTEQRISVGETSVQLVASNVLRLSVVIVHAGETGSLFIRTGGDDATATAWVARLEPGDLVELETTEAVQALASAGTIPVNVTEVA